jgi:hypothetical protein
LRNSFKFENGGAVLLPVLFLWAYELSPLALIAKNEETLRGLYILLLGGLFYPPLVKRICVKVYEEGKG